MTGNPESIDDPEVAAAILAYVEDQQKAVEFERNEETKRLKDRPLSTGVLEKLGLAFRSMKVESCSIAHYGAVLISFIHAEKYILPASHIGPGDVVAVSAGVNGNYEYDCTGTDYIDIWGYVEQMTDENITIAVEKFKPIDTVDGNLFLIRKLPNNVTHNRLKAALKSMISSPQETKYLTDVLFGNKPLEQIPIPRVLLDFNDEVDFRNTFLHSGQRSAIEFALQQKTLAIIHGPPGTGKTTVLAELIFQLAKSGEKVLVCAPSNIAVDAIMSQALHYSMKAVRIGHPSRMSPKMMQHTVDAYIGRESPNQQLKEAKMELKKVCEKLMKYCNPQDQIDYNSQVTALRQEIKRRERKVAREALSSVNCVFVTLTSAHRDNLMRYFPEGFFSTIIIDECSQALEAACWVAIPYAKRCILAGDHHQLAPVIMTREALNLGMGITLMERAISKLGKDCYRLLTHQYRMNNEIMSWVSHETYDDQLTADVVVASQMLKDLPDVMQTEYTVSALLLIDTSDCGLSEHCHHLSYGNLGEADLITVLVCDLMFAGLIQEEIAVITPYKRQVDIIKGSLEQRGLMRIEVKTVDGFQGREKEIVLLSLVRSNPNGDVGFLADPRRMNVAVSRARRFLGVVADSKTVSTDSTCASLINHIINFGDRRTGFEYAHDLTSVKLAPTGDIPHILPLVAQKSLEAKAKRDLLNETTKITVQLHKLLVNEDGKPLLIEVAGSPTAFNKMTFMESIQVPVPEPQASHRLYKGPVMEHFRQILVDFLAGTEEEVIFPKELSSYDRMCLHVVAGHMRLEHFSVGEEGNRCAVVRKPRPLGQLVGPSTSKPENKEPTPKKEKKQKKKKVRGFEALSVNDGDDTLPEGNASLPEDSATLPEGKVPNTEGDVETIISDDEATSAHQGRRARRGKKKVIKEKKAIDTTDEMLNKIVKELRVCSAKTCKVPVRIIGHDCLFCRQRFCFSHTLPEIHGCGEQARQAAQKAFTNPPPKPISDAKKKALKKMLNKKLDEKSAIRSGVPKGMI